MRQGWLFVGLRGGSLGLSPSPKEVHPQGRARERGSPGSAGHSVPSVGISPGHADRNLGAHSPGEKNARIECWAGREAGAGNREEAGRPCRKA